MSTPEMGFNPELQKTRLPENPADYEGSFVTPENGKTNLASAVELMRIYSAVEQEQGN